MTSAFFLFFGRRQCRHVPYSISINLSQKVTAIFLEMDCSQDKIAEPKPQKLKEWQSEAFRRQIW